MVNLHQLVDTVSHVINLKGATVGKVNGARHRLGLATIGIARHGEHHVAAGIAFHLAVSDGVLIVNRLAIIDLDLHPLTVEQRELNLVHVVHKPLEDVLIQRHKLVLLGKLEVGHRPRGFIHLHGDQLVAFGKTKIRRHHSAQEQNAARADDQFPVQN